MVHPRNAEGLDLLAFVHRPHHRHGARSRDRGHQMDQPVAAGPRSRVQIDGYDASPQSDELAEVVVTEVVDDDHLDRFLDEVEAYLAATAESAYLLFVEDDDKLRRRGVFNCWTLGRRDPRPLILLRRLLPSMSGESLLVGVTVLAHVTHHPDIF